MRFVGGTQKLDIWVYAEDTTDLRFVWGLDSHRWHWVRLSDNGQTVVLDNSDLAGTLADAPTPEEMQQAHVYLRLFAPWVFGEVT